MADEMADRFAEIVSTRIPNLPAGEQLRISSSKVRDFALPHLLLQRSAA